MHRRRAERAAGVPRLSADRDGGTGTSPGEVPLEEVLRVYAVGRAADCDVQGQDVADADVERFRQRERYVDRQPVGVFREAVQGSVIRGDGQLDPGQQPVDAAAAGDAQPELAALDIGLL